MIDQSLTNLFVADNFKKKNAWIKEMPHSVIVSAFEFFDS